MAVLFSTALWFLALVAAWRLWKRTFRDCVRDDLFDVRDAWRAFWLASGRDMGDPAYAAFRREINSYLRYTSAYRFSDLVYVSRNRARIKAALDACGEREVTGNAEVMHEVRRLRAKAIVSLQAYMVGTSVLVFPVFAVAVAAVFVKRLSFAASFLKATARLANTVPFGCPETIRQAALLQPAAA